MSKNTKTTYYLAFYKPERRWWKQSRWPLRWWDWMICFLDGSPYSHVELVLERSTDGHLYRCLSSSPRDGGVRSKWMPLPAERWVMIPVDINVSSALYIERSRKGDKYDWLGLGATIFSWWPHHKDRWFCSELCAYILQLKNSQTYGLKKLYSWATGPNNPLYRGE